VMLALALLGCAGTPVPTLDEPLPLEPAPAEVAEPPVEFAPVPLAAFGVLDSRSCGAAAFAPGMLLTAAHCLRADAAPGDAGPKYVDAETYVAAAGGYAGFYETFVIDVDRANDRAVLGTREDLPAWTSSRSAVVGEPARVVVQEFEPTRFDSYEDRVAEGNLLARPAFAKGDSGSPVYSADGELVGVMITCEGAEGRCYENGGRFAPPLTL
jgi:V8-like Glu-specific endopeptidase